MLLRSVVLAFIFAPAVMHCSTTWQERVPEEISCTRGKGREAAIRILQAARTELIVYEDDLRAYHKAESLEKIRLYSNERLRGVVVCVNSRILYLHTVTGVRRIRRAEIATQEY